MRRFATVLILVVAFLIIFSPSAKANDGKNFLKLSEPRDSFMTSADRILISGETVPKSSVAIIINGHRKGKELSVGAAGVFLTQVPIDSKENIVTVRASFPSGSTETVSRKVYKLEDESKLQELDCLIQTLRTILILK